MSELGWSDRAYADTRSYLAARADVIRALGPPLAPGDVVLDLACGDGRLGAFLPEQRYLGVDGDPGMVAAGRAHGVDIAHADLNDYTPPESVAVTTIFRAIYHARDRRALFDRIAGYTTKKLVFDLNPRQYRLGDVRADLEGAGLDRLDVTPFFVPQTRALPPAALAAVRRLERSRTLATLVLRARFTLICAASRAGAS